jgi:hypothetical protein
MSGKYYIPNRFVGMSVDEGKALLEAAGVKFLGSRLERFFEIIVPDTMTISRDSPRMQVIYDSDGNLRGNISVGADPTEEGAVQLFQRFCVTFDIITIDNHDYAVGKVFNGNKLAYESEHIPFPTLPSARKKMAAKAIELAMTWVDTLWPDWRNPPAYW